MYMHVCTVESIYNPEALGVNRPLTNQEWWRLHTNIPRLMLLMDLMELSSTLLSLGVISPQQHEYIRSQTTPTHEKNIEFVDILLRRSYANYKQFLEALRNTKQGHVENILINGGGGFTESSIRYFTEFPKQGISEGE